MTGEREGIFRVTAGAVESVVVEEGRADWRVAGLRRVRYSDLSAAVHAARLALDWYAAVSDDGVRVVVWCGDRRVVDLGTAGDRRRYLLREGVAP